VSQKKTPYSCPYLHEILIDSKNSFNFTLSSKFAVKQLLNILILFKHVATLPCEMLAFNIAPTEGTAMADQIHITENVVK